MKRDYFAYIKDHPDLQEFREIPVSLSMGFVDRISLKALLNDKIEARNQYMEHASQGFEIPKFVKDFIPDFSYLPSPDWLGFQVDFDLLTSWYSKDDRILHVLDNPVRKEWIFGVPFMAGSSWKGMLRWVFRMHLKLTGPEKETDNEKIEQARAWELHLFGNEKGEEKFFHRGALVFYPTWFNKIGFEVINPHRRATRAGTQPIYYEVVPGRRVIKNQDGSLEEIEGAKGVLSLLYAPWPGMRPAANPREVLPRLLEAIESLLTTYGISAKRTVGWGTARILKWRAFHKRHDSIERDRREALWDEIKDWLPEGDTP